MSANQAAEPQTEMTAEECFESLTGYEEIAIAKSFGKEITTLAEDHPTTFARALVFAMLRRDGATDTDAKNWAMERPLGEIHAYFTEEPDDLDPSDPDSESGKDDSSREASLGD